MCRASPTVEDGSGRIPASESGQLVGLRIRSPAEWPDSTKRTWVVARERSRSAGGAGAGAESVPPRGGIPRRTLRGELLADRRHECVDVGLSGVVGAHPAHLVPGRVPVVEAELLTQPIGNPGR